jgi:L,D-peptidoglycan transpeptidase YkuD (ErfK/YbiS/YcfS/YnhG family)
MAMATGLIAPAAASAAPADPDSPAAPDVADSLPTTTPAPDAGGSIGSAGGSQNFWLSDSPTGAGARHVTFGRASDEVYIADIDGDGRDEMVVRRGNVFHVSGSGGQSTTTRQFTYGRATDTVYFGDWDGNGTDTPAVRRGNRFFVRNTSSTGVADSELDYGRAADDPGDFDGNGTDTFAIRRGTEVHVRNSLTTGTAEAIFTYGRATDSILVGDMDGDGRDTFHVWRGGTLYVNDRLGGGAAQRSFRYAAAYDVAILGDWNGDGTDTIGVRSADQSGWGRCAPLSQGQSRYDTRLTDHVSMSITESWTSSYSTFTMCERVPGSEAYRELWSTSARIGSAGTARVGEPAAWYTYKTPTGAFSVTESFGLYNPGTALHHRILNSRSRWGGTHGTSTYNQYFEGAPSSAYMAPDENLWYFATRPQGDYRVGAVINYNRQPDSAVRQGMGYAIFLHTNPVATAGCIAIPEHLVARYLQQTEPGDMMLLGVRSHVFG